MTTSRKANRKSPCIVVLGLQTVKKQWLDDAVLELVTFNWSLFWSSLRLWLSRVGQWSSSLLLVALLCSSDWIGVGTLTKNRNGRRFSSNARRRYN